MQVIGNHLLLARPSPLPQNTQHREDLHLPGLCGNDSSDSPSSQCSFILQVPRFQNSGHVSRITEFHEIVKYKKKYTVAN